jgi:hypothetical protein
MERLSPWRETEISIQFSAQKPKTRKLWKGKNQPIPALGVPPRVFRPSPSADQAGVPLLVCPPLHSFRLGFRWAADWM